MSTMTSKHKPAKAKTAAEALTTAAAVAGTLILLNVLTCNARAKVDLTQNSIYSLSKASKHIVQGMPEKVNIRAYFGNVPSELAEKQTYVDMLLSEYAEASGGKIDYQRVEPWNKPELQEELKKEGINKLTVMSDVDGKVEQVQIYFHVVFSHLDKKETWTAVDTHGFVLEGLEYEFSTRIKRLGYGKKKVGVTTGFGEPPQAQWLMKPGAEVLRGTFLGLGDLYDVQMVNWNQNPKSIDDLDALIVDGPTEKLSDAAKYHLDQYIMKGKPALILTSGMKWQASGNKAQMMVDPSADQPYLGTPGDNGLGDLLATYGVEVQQNTILDPRNTGLGMVPPGSPNGYRMAYLFPVAQSLQADEKQLLQGIPWLFMPYASSLKLVGPLEKGSTSDTNVIPLLRTLPTSYARKELVAVTRGLKPEAPKDAEKGPFLVGVAIAGKFKSYYADHAPPANPDAAGQAMPQQPGGGMMMPGMDGEADGSESQPAAPALPPAASGPAAPAAAAGSNVLKESASHTRVIVISAPALVQDVTLAAIVDANDLPYVNGFVAAHDLVDWLAEDVDLVGVRSKKIERPIERMEVGKKATLRYANVFGAPLVLILFGVIYWRVRDRKRHHIAL